MDRRKIVSKPKLLDGFRVCRCGCETIFRRRSHRPGTEAYFLKGHNQKGIYHSMWKGGKHLKHGYVKVWCPDHPHNHLGYIYEHRLVMETYLGRYLTRQEKVHHLDGDRTNNVIENLELIHDEEHTTYHNNLRKKSSRPDG